VTAGDLDLSTASGRLIAGVLVQVSKHEVDRTRERLASMNSHAAAAGKRVGGRRAFGYETDGLTIRESEAAVWREMADWVLAGSSIRSLSLELNARGIKTAGDGEFSPSRVRDILRNPRYVGLRTYRHEIVADAEWPSLIDRAKWEKLIAVLNDPARRTTPGPAPKHLLAGFLRCGICGGRVASRTNHRKQAYGCRAKGSGGCGGVVINAERLEEQVTEWLFEALDDPRLTDAIAEHETTTNDESIGSEISTLEQRLDGLATAFADGEISRRQLAAGSEKLNAELNRLRRLITPRKTPLAAIEGGKAARSLWEDEGLEFRRELIAAVIDRIVVNPSSNRGSNYHDASRVVIHART
jgi:hypothetical protein